ncbi:MAG: hypothetical protein A2020_06820 [Lentisphaerae bacterium GWF2_45_14]|nr:MAG: hypothetical protein A2020_06820 [Lentisphaerae bacterium GWF2_45_14]
MKLQRTLAAVFIFILIAGTGAQEKKDPGEKPSSFYLYYGDKSKLLPESDKGYSYDDAVKKAKVKDFSFGRTRPEPVFASQIKTDKKGSIDEQSVPFDVLEESGVERNAFVRFGFPLPEGAIFDPAKIKITDSANNELPAQIEATAFWKDISLKWVLVQFNTQLKAGEKKVFNAVFGNNVQKKPYASKLRFFESANDATLYSGPLKVSIDKKRFNILKTVWVDRNSDGNYSDDEKVGGFSPDGIRMLDENLNLFTSTATAPASFSVEERGSEVIVLKIKGQYARKDASYKKLMDYVVRLTFHKDSPVVKVTMTHINTNVQTEFTDISSLGLDFVLPEDAETLTALTAKNDALTALKKVEFLQFDDREILSSGKKQPGRLKGPFEVPMKNAKLGLSIRDCWQRWPKSVGVDGKALSIGILPEQPSKNYGRNLPHYLQFPFCEGKYRMKWGMSFTEEIFFDFGGSDSMSKMDAESNMPVIAVINPAWYAKTQALSGISFPIGKQFSIWDNVISKAFDEHMTIKDEQREYGFFNYGDCYGERGRNWNNNEYDFAHGLFMDFIRTGNRKHFRWAMITSKHQADVDCVHAYPDKYYIGSNHQHSIGHTGNWSQHHVRAEWTHLYDSHTSADNGHTWVNGLIDAWCMGGDPISMNAAYGLGEHIAWAMAPTFEHLGSHERSAGWSLRAIASLYRLTNDPLYLKAADKIAAVAMREQKMDCGAWPHVLPGDHAGPDNQGAVGNCPYLMGIILNSLKTYHEATGNPEAAKSITAGAKWLEKAWSPQACGWPYSASPEGKPYWSPKPSPLNILICAPMAYAGNISDNKEFIEISEKAFLAAIMSFSPKGKDFAFGMIFSSELLCEIQKWHLKNSEDKGVSLLSNDVQLVEFIRSLKCGSNLNLRMPDKKTVLASLKKDKAVVKIDAKKHGSRPNTIKEGNLTLKGPDGSVINKIPFDINKAFHTELELKGKPGDIFTIEAFDDMTNVWNIESDDADISAMFKNNASIGAVGFSKYFFFVPAGTKEFEIILKGIHEGRFGGMAIQPDGKINSFMQGENTGGTQLPWATDKFKSAESQSLKVKVPEGLDGKNWNMRVWASGDISIGFKGIPPYISGKNSVMPTK